MKLFGHSQKVGLAPGSLVYVGSENRDRKIQLSSIDFGPGDVITTRPLDLADCGKALNNSFVTWIDVDGVHDIDVIKEIGRQFNIINLDLEDVLNTFQRPKVVFNENYIYTNLKMIRYDEQKETFSREQISIFLFENIVITMQETPGDVFNNLRKRITQGKGKVRKLGADYLNFCLIDSIVDEYFVVLEKIQTELEEIEDKVLAGKDEEVLADIHWLKKELLYVRRAISPVRELINSYFKEESSLVTQETVEFFKDTYGHTIQIYENVEIQRDIISGLVEMHLTNANNRMNEVMKYLTVFASIFIPLTFLTGIYGMNFENMPELKTQNGYFIFLGVLAVVGISLFVLFKKKKWL